MRGERAALPAGAAGSSASAGAEAGPGPAAVAAAASHDACGALARAEAANPAADPSGLRAAKGLTLALLSSRTRTSGDGGSVPARAAAGLGSTVTTTEECTPARQGDAAAARDPAPSGTTRDDMRDLCGAGRREGGLAAARPASACGSGLASRAAAGGCSRNCRRWPPTQGEGAQVWRERCAAAGGCSAARPLRSLEAVPGNVHEPTALLPAALPARCAAAAAGCIAWANRC